MTRTDAAATLAGLGVWQVGKWFLVLYGVLLLLVVLPGLFSAFR